MDLLARFGRWSALHTLAAAWAAYLSLFVVLRAYAPEAALQWAPTVLLMLVLTGWLARWWIGAVIDAAVSIIWVGLGLVSIELDLGGGASVAEALGMYIFGLIFLGLGRMGHHVWARTRQARDQEKDIQELEEVRAFQARFLNMAAHEISTPLTPLKLQLENIRHKHDDPDLLRDVELLARNVARLERLTQDLLVAGRLQDQALRVERVSIDLREIVEDVAASCKDLAAARKIRFETEIKGPLTVQGDAHRLAQVIWNLCRNALKFTPEGGRITLRARDGGDVLIEVEDDGLGMEAQQIEELFEPFTQFHREQVREGTGLGLYIARGIMEQHGGGLDAHSDGPGRGSRFRLWLPADEGDDRAAMGHAAMGEATGAQEAASS